MEKYINAPGIKLSECVSVLMAVIGVPCVMAGGEKYCAFGSSRKTNEGGKMKIWLFEDDDERYRQIKEHLKRSEVKVDIMRFKSVVEEMDRIGSPDVIAIDGTAICGQGIQPLGCMDMFYSNLRYFAEKHTSSHFIIYCAVRIWAKDFAEGLIQDLKESVVVEVVDGDSITVAKKICLLTEGK